MPVNTSALDHILNSFRIGKEIAGQQNEQELQKQRLEQEKALREEELKQAENHFKSQQSLDEARFGLIKAQAGHNILQSYTQSGNVPAGGSVKLPQLSATPGVTGNPQQGFENQPISTNDVPAGQAQVTLPQEFGGGTSIVDQPETAAKKQGQLEVLRQQPKFDLEEQKAALEEQRQTKLKEIEAHNAAIQKDLDRRAEDIRNQRDNATHVAVSKNTVSGELIRNRLDAFDKNPMVQRYAISKSALDSIKDIPDNTQDPVQQKQIMEALAQTMTAHDVAMGKSSYDAMKEGLNSIAGNLGLKMDSLLQGKQTILEPGVIKSLKTQVESNVNANKQFHDALRGQTQNAIKQNGGDPNWVHDFSGAPSSNYGPVEVKTLKDGTKVNVRLNKSTGKYEDAPK